MKRKIIFEQVIPILLTIAIFLFLCFALFLEITLLNKFTDHKIVTVLRKRDVIIGLTIYLKTSIDFAIYIGLLMKKNPGWKQRVAIEIGTALGNGLGTFVILGLWNFFREIQILMALMIFIASLVLLKLAEEGIEHAKNYDKAFSKPFKKLVNSIEFFLKKVNTAVAPFLKFLIPNLSLKKSRAKSFLNLFIIALTIPFILGLDDFAGYVPLFNIVNVFGFAIGVFLGHMILNILLYISPKNTIRAVKNPLISFIGALFFIGLSLWGSFEVIKILLEIIHTGT